MAEIIITIPELKVSLVKSSIEFAVCGEYPIPVDRKLNKVEALAWLQTYLENSIRVLAENYQEAKYVGGVILTDPLN